MTDSQHLHLQQPAIPLTIRTSRRFDLIVSILLIIFVIGMALVYLVSNLGVSAGINTQENKIASTNGSNPIMPLDDTYIHFQYARVLAEGHLMRYNPDQPPTSGATSLVYPVLLAIGYKLGFNGERLAWWALLIGVLCWIGSALVLYRIASRADTPSARWIGFGIAAAFVFTGSFQWAFMSGMETGLTVLVTLMTIWYALQENRNHTVFIGCLAALVRPEGLIVALAAELYLANRESSRQTLIRHLPLYLAPILCALIQPLLNLIMTGSVTASGMLAKSYLYDVPADPSTIAAHIWNNITRMLGELATGYSPDDGPYYLFVLSLFAGIGILISLVTAWRERKVTPGLMLALILLGLIAVVSILETAFWQFKRYQQPMMVLLFPLAAWALIAAVRYRPQQETRMLAGLMVLIIVTTSLFISSFYLGFYIGNVVEVGASQRRMAAYVSTAVPSGMVVGVHDIGIMRYLSDHLTYDLVGLTTPGAAQAWRSGPGAVFEQMLTSPYRPDYFAIYKDARGLSYLASTDLYKTALASFPSTQPARNVASATNSGQSVYKADWTFAAFAAQPMQPSSLQAIKGMSLSDSVNVANLNNERDHDYRWWEAVKRPGFATELYELDGVDCQPTQENPTCKAIDGGRLITGGEEMTVSTTPGQEMIWVTRVHGHNPATLTMYVNDKPIGTRIVPMIPGKWFEIASYIPGSAITGTKTRVRVEANISDPSVGFYMPYYHWFYQGKYQAPQGSGQKSNEVVATFGQSIVLSHVVLDYNVAQHIIKVSLEWHGAEKDPVDASVFVHLYSTDTNSKPIAQAGDVRPFHNTLPPANWLPGVITDEYMLIIPDGTPAGSYQVAIGLYNPLTNERLPIAEGKGDQDRRLFIGTVAVK